MHIPGICSHFCSRFGRVCPPRFPTSALFRQATVRKIMEDSPESLRHQAAESRKEEVGEKGKGKEKNSLLLITKLDADIQESGRTPHFP